MRYEDIEERLRHEYQVKCSCCELVTTILTQIDDDSEYETKIYVICMCGEYLKFILPVN